MALINPFTSEMLDCFLSCPRGLEDITAKDIQPFCQSVTTDRGGVKYSGDLRSLYNVNLHSRTGMHALVKLISVRARSNDELYKEVLAYPWHEWITPVDTIFIRSRVRSRYFDNAQFASLKVKDALVDCIRN